MPSIFTLEDALRRLPSTSLTAVMVSEFRESRLLDRISIKSITGAHEEFMKLTQLPTAQRRMVNDVFTTTRSTTSPGAEHLRIFGLKMSHDRFLIKTGMSDIVGEVASASKAIRLKMESDLIYGNPLDEIDFGAVSGLQFFSDNSSGNEVITSQSAGNDANGAPLSIRFLKSAISKANPRATMLVMGEDTQGLITSAATDVGATGTITYSVDDLGRNVTSFAGLPIVTMGYDELNQQILTFNEPDFPAGANDTASIYIVSEGVTDGGWYAFENGGPFIEGDGETSAPSKTRELEWYFGTVRPLPLAVIRIKHIGNKDVVR